MFSNPGARVWTIGRTPFSSLVGDVREQCSQTARSRWRARTNRRRAEVKLSAGRTRATTANPIKPTLPFSRIPGLEVFGSVTAIPVVFRHYPAQTRCISSAAIRRTAKPAARIPPRCSPVFMSRSRHDAPIRLLLPGAASPAIRVPVGCLPGLFGQTERLPQHPYMRT